MNCETYHIPVLLEQTIEGLNIRPNGVYVDLTFGGGGHSREIMKQLGKEGRLFGFDQDMDAMAGALQDERFCFVRSNFRFLKNWMMYYGIEQVDGILADLGVSSHHLDAAERGFSFRYDAPLDMRMNQEGETTAADIINNYSRAQLISLFKKYADVRTPNKVVDSIIKEREHKPITSTLELAEIIAQATPGSLQRKHPAKVYFQALRIEVNKELDVLAKALEKACKLLKPKGRLCVITFHSLEDRIVKNYFKELTEVKDLYGKQVPLRKMSKPEFKLVTRKPVVPTKQEMEQNRRSHSAKLRVIEKM